MIIDFHTHCFDDALAPYAVSTLEKNGGIKAKHDGTVSGLREYMRQCGVDLCVVHPVATKSAQVKTINQWAMENTDNIKSIVADNIISENTQKHSERSRLCLFGALHPDDPNFLNTAQQLKNDGFKGVKLHPDYQRFYADESRMMPLYEALRDLGLIVVLHAGVDIGHTALIRCTPLMIANIINNVPGLKLVAAHMGGHALWRDAEMLLCGKDLYLDTSYAWYKLGRQGMARMIEKHGADKVLFGTDSPWKDTAAEIAHITSLGLSTSQTDLIMYKNAQALLEI